MTKVVLGTGRTGTTPNANGKFEAVIPLSAPVTAGQNLTATATKPGRSNGTDQTVVAAAAAPEFDPALKYLQVKWFNNPDQTQGIALRIVNAAGDESIAVPMIGAVNVHGSSPYTNPLITMGQETAYPWPPANYSSLPILEQGTTINKNSASMSYQSDGWGSPGYSAQLGAENEWVTLATKSV